MKIRLFLTTMFIALANVLFAQTQPAIKYYDGLIKLRATTGETKTQSMDNCVQSLGMFLSGLREAYLVYDINQLDKSSGTITYGNDSNYEHIEFGSNTTIELAKFPVCFNVTTKDSVSMEVIDTFSLQYAGESSPKSTDFYFVFETLGLASGYDLFAIPIRVTTYKEPTFTTCPATERRVCRKETVSVNFQDILSAANTELNTNFTISSFPDFVLVKDIDQISVTEGEIDYGRVMDELQFMDHNEEFTEKPTGTYSFQFPLSFTGKLVVDQTGAAAPYLESLILNLTGQADDTTDEFYLIGEDKDNEGAFYVFPIKLETVTRMKTCQTIAIKVPQGNVETKEITNVLTGEGHTIADMTSGTHSVKALFVSSLNDVNYTKTDGLSTTAANSKIVIFGATDSPTEDIPVFFSYDEGQNISKVFFNLKGSTATNTKNLYMVLVASGENSTDYEVEVYPIYAETYNAFQTNSYTGITDENLEKYRYSNSNVPFYVKKVTASGPTYVMTEPVINFNWLNKELTCDKNGYYDIFGALNTGEDILAESMFVSKNSNGGYFLTTNEGLVLTIWDEGVGSYNATNNETSFNYSLYSVGYLAIEENDNLRNNRPLQIFKSGDGHVIYSEFTSHVYDSTTFDSKNITARFFLDYNPATGKFGIIPYDVTGLTTAEIEALETTHRLNLYTVNVEEDNTPHFQPRNDEVTIDNTEQTDQTIFNNATNPYEIEITFDRELAVIEVDGIKKAIDMNGGLVEESELFNIEIIDDNTTSTPAPRRNGPRRAPRLPIVNSTSVKSSAGLTNNVMCVQLNYVSQPNSNSSSAPRRVSGPVKAPRLPVVNSTSVKVSAQMGAFQYANSVSSAPKRTQSRSSEPAYSAAFGFEYHVITDDVTNAPDPNDANYEEELAAYNELLNKVIEVVLNQPFVDLNVGTDGIITYNAESIDTRSTNQLDFYKVSDIDFAGSTGVITLKKIHGVASGPMMVMRAHESLTHAVTVEKGESPVAITENYLRYCKANDNDPETKGDVIPYLFDGIYPADVANGTVAENYFFGKSKTSDGAGGYTYGPLGFYLLNITTDWQNTRDTGIVYLHNYKRSEITPARMRVVLEDGREILDVPTSIMPAIMDAYTKPNNHSYNVLGQKVGSNYHGIIIRNGKKILNK